MTTDQIKDMLEGQLRELGLKASGELNELAIATSESMERLSASVGTPGFERAVAAERDVLMMEGAIAAIDTADATDQTIMGFVTGFLGMGAAALRASAGGPGAV